MGSLYKISKEKLTPDTIISEGDEILYMDQDDGMVLLSIKNLQDLTKFLPEKVDSCRHGDSFFNFDIICDSIDHSKLKKRVYDPGVPFPIDDFFKQEDEQLTEDIIKIYYKNATFENGIAYVDGKPLAKVS